MSLRVSTSRSCTTKESLLASSSSVLHMFNSQLLQDLERGTWAVPWRSHSWHPELSCDKGLKGLRSWGWSPQGSHFARPRTAGKTTFKATFQVQGQRPQPPIFCSDVCAKSESNPKCLCKSLDKTNAKTAYSRQKSDLRQIARICPIAAWISNNS